MNTNKLTRHGEVAHGSVTINSEGFTITYRHDLPNKSINYTFINQGIDIDNNLVTYYHNNNKLTTHYHRPNTYENITTLLNALNTEYSGIGYNVSAFDIIEIIIYKDTEIVKCQELFWMWYVDQIDIKMNKNIIVYIE